MIDNYSLKISPNHHSGAKVYGCAPGPPPPDSEEDSDEIAAVNFAPDFLFAPKDNKEFSFKAKDDYHGIGYRGLNPGMAVLGGGHVDLFGEDEHSTSGKRGIRGQVSF